MKLKSIFLFIIVIIILLGVTGYFYIYSKQKTTSVITPAPTQTAASALPTITALPSPTATLSATITCTPKDLRSSLMLSPAAGNIYGTLNIKNISNKTCQIQGNNLIEVVYDKLTIKNIATNYEGKAANATVILSPNQVLYSQVHYPNGPQCQSGIELAPIAFTYMIAKDNSVTFLNETGKTSQSITLCKSPTEITTIDLWPISLHPITPQ